MFASLVLAASIIGQTTYLPPMTPRQLQEYKIEQGYRSIKSIENPRQKALQRYYDKRNRRARDISEMRFTPAAAFRFAFKHPPGSVYWRTHSK